MFLRPHDDAPALVDADQGYTLSHRELATAARAFAAHYRRRGMVFLFADGSADAVIAHVAALDSGTPVALIDPAAGADQVDRLVDLYRPSVVVRPMGGAWCPAPDCYSAVARGIWVRRGRPEVVAHPELAVLLTTSGSTGSPKLVRLSRRNIAVNTDAIAESLGLGRADRAVLTLPLHYSFGMSILHTHLAVGGSVVVTGSSLLEQRFWEMVGEHRPTSLSGVPYTFHMLRRVGFASRDTSSVRYMTQAGGKLESSSVSHFAQAMADRGGEFYVMYGQTEAAPRMTCLPSCEWPDRSGSAGRPLTGGRIDVVDEHGRPLPSHRTGDIVYTGPNVMMGYAERPADLELGDVHGDRLVTGDVGHLDDDGFVYITGRTARIGKLFGTRVCLDEVEQMLQGQGPVAVVAGTDSLVVHHEWAGDTEVDEHRRRLALDLRVPLSSIRFRRSGPLPRMSNGKVDYRTLDA